MKIRLAGWPLPAGVYYKREHYPVPEPMLRILQLLMGGEWTARDREEETTSPQPGAPMCEHHSRWVLRRDGVAAGELLGVVCEGGLNMPWPDYEVVRVEARLGDGRAVTAGRDRTKLWLSGEGFAQDALAEAATEAGLELRTFPA